MKVALLSPDGLSVLLFCRAIVRELRALPGAEVIVVSHPGAYTAEIEALGARSIALGTSRFMNPLADFIYMIRLAWLFRREQVQVVFNLSTKPNIYGTLAARAAGVPTVVSYVVGLGTAFLDAADARSRLLRRITIALYRRACAWSTKVWFTNPNDLALFVAERVVDPARAILTKFYVDLHAYSPDAVAAADVAALRAELGLCEGERVVVMVARMIWPKGIREFAEAAERLRERLPSVRFVLVAPMESGSVHAVPESYIREMEQRARLTWVGFRDDVKRFYAMADLAVLPSYYREGGYPRALTEPMAMGKPLVTTTNEDCRAPVEHGRNGFHVPIRDSAALAAAIATLMEDTEMRASFGRYSRKKAELEYDEDRVVAEAFNLLKLKPT